MYHMLLYSQYGISTMNAFKGHLVQKAWGKAADNFCSDLTQGPAEWLLGGETSRIGYLEPLGKVKQSTNQI